jgi:hypothetical protein
MKTKHNITLAICLFLFWACRSQPEIPEPTLPQHTREGKSTLGCYVNGEMFIADDVNLGMGLGSSTSATIYSDSVLLISCKDLDFSKSTIELSLILHDDNKDYPLVYNPNYPATMFTDFSDFGGVTYRVNPRQNGLLTITRITDEFVSGTFQFTGISQEGDTVRISDGRFDVRFRQF